MHRERTRQEEKALNMLGHRRWLVSMSLSMGAHSYHATDLTSYFVWLVCYLCTWSDEFPGERWRAAVLIFCPIFGVCFELLSFPPPPPLTTSTVRRPKKASLYSPPTCHMLWIVSGLATLELGEMEHVKWRQELEFDSCRTAALCFLPPFFCFHYWFNWTIDGWRAEENY